jgi:hypothetical protein
MKTNELLIKYINKDKHPRVLGRYWATDIYKIIIKQLTPENFFNPEPIANTEAIGRMLDGMANEMLLKDIYDYCNVSYKYGKNILREMKIDDEITLVVKPDFEFPDWIAEMKNPVREREEIPDWYIYQLECEYRACNKPVKLGVFVHPFDVHYIDFVPDDKRWEKIVKTLKEFHAKLKQLKVDKNETLKILKIK